MKVVNVLAFLLFLSGLFAQIEFIPQTTVTLPAYNAYINSEFVTVQSEERILVWYRDSSALCAKVCNIDGDVLDTWTFTSIPGDSISYAAYYESGMQPFVAVGYQTSETYFTNAAIRVYDLTNQQVTVMSDTHMGTRESHSDEYSGYSSETSYSVPCIKVALLDSTPYIVGTFERRETGHGWGDMSYSSDSSEYQDNLYIFSVDLNMLHSTYAYHGYGRRIAITGPQQSAIQSFGVEYSGVSQDTYGFGSFCFHDLVLRYMNANIGTWQPEISETASGHHDGNSSGSPLSSFNNYPCGYCSMIGSVDPSIDSWFFTYSTLTGDNDYDNLTDTLCSYAQGQWGAESPWSVDCDSTFESPGDYEYIPNISILPGSGIHITAGPEYALYFDRASHYVVRSLLDGHIAYRGTAPMTQPDEMFSTADGYTVILRRELANVFLWQLGGDVVIPFYSPTNLQITTDSVGDSVTLNWSAAEHATGYRVYSSNDIANAFPGSWTLEGNTTGTTFSVSTVAAAKKFYRVTSIR
jgi:hypothetical protein